MSHQSRTRRSKRAAALVAGGIAAVLLPLGFAGSAVAATAHGDGKAAVQHATATEVKDNLPDNVAKVTEFYNGYLAARGEGDQVRADQLRQDYLDPAFLPRLEQWEAEHNADGVTHSQQTPVRVDVAYDGSGMGKSHAIVTLHFDNGGPVKQLHVESSLETEKITDITDMP